MYAYVSPTSLSEAPGLYICASIALIIIHIQFSQFSHSVVSDSLQPRRLQYASLPCPSPTPRACSNSCPSSQWCHRTISSSVTLFSCLESSPTSGSFPMSQFFTSGGQSIGVSASVLPVHIQDWFPLGWTGLISLQSNLGWKSLGNVLDLVQLDCLYYAAHLQVSTN